MKWSEDVRGGKWLEAGENCIMRGFRISTPHQMLLMSHKVGETIRTLGRVEEMRIAF
jgi:hypothetical protein